MRANIYGFGIDGLETEIPINIEAKSFGREKKNNFPCRYIAKKFVPIGSKN